MKLLLFLLMIISAVLLGLVIAYLYLRRLADSTGRARREAQVVPLLEKHAPADFTPTTASLDRSKRQIKDDLKRITGIGPKLERTLNANGIVTFRQIANWQDADIEKNDKLLKGFHGRIRRDDWVGQAKQLSK